MSGVFPCVCGAVLSVVVSSVAIAQEMVSLSLDQVETLFYAHNLDRAFHLQETTRLKGLANDFKAFPNPALSVYREGHSNGGPPYSETVISLRQEVEIYGQPSLRSRVASDEIAAADGQFRQDELVLLNTLKAEYVALLFLHYKRTTQHNTLEALRRTYATAQNRQSEGEISGFEAQRFALDLGVYEQIVVNTDIEYESRLSALLVSLGGSLAVGLDSASLPFIAERVQLSDSLTFRAIDLSPVDAERLALEHRRDLQGANRLLDATGRRRTIVRRNRLPQWALEAGFKRQIDGTQGYVAGASFSLPLFNQNRGAIQSSEARHSQQETILSRLRSKIKLEVHTASYAVKALAAQWKSLQTLTLSPTMRDVAWLSYSEGQLTLLEWLDAVQASNSATLLRASILADYNRKLIDLDTAMGGALFQNEDERR